MSYALCNLLEASRSQIIEPYTVTHIEVKSRDRSYGKGHGTYMITPLSNTSLFEDQPGLVSPSVTVNKQTTGGYLLPIVNNTGKIFNVKNRTVIAFIEHLHRTDLVEHYTHNSTHTSTVHAKNRQHFHTNTISNHKVAKINNKDKSGCSDKEYNIGNEIDIVKYNFLVYTLNKHQISIAPEDREKTSFCTRTSLLEFNRMPFGIASAPAIFQRMISKVLHGIEGKYAMAYLDDILIYSDSFENHLKHIEDIFQRLEKADYV